jgi:hypothetical protein
MSPVFISVTRTAQCYFCSEQWVLDNLEYPEKCAHCGSLDWEYGPTSKDAIWIRQGIKRLRKTLNPGAKSKKRQTRGKSQWRRFKKKDGQNV